MSGTPRCLCKMSKQLTWNSIMVAEDCRLGSDATEKEIGFKFQMEMITMNIFSMTWDDFTHRSWRPVTMASILWVQNFPDILLEVSMDQVHKINRQCVSQKEQKRRKPSHVHVEM